MESIECPACGDTISLQPPFKPGATFYCPSCDALLQIVTTIPLLVKRIITRWDVDDEEDVWATHGRRSASSRYADDEGY